MVSGWQKIQTVAEIVIALSAVAGLAFALYQNWTTTRVINAAYHAFSAQSYPVVKYSHYQWFSGEEVSCSSPANGINVYVRNFSGVPVVIERTTLKLAYGDRPIFPSPGFDTHEPQEVILPPGIDIAQGRSGVELKQLFPTLLGRGSPPHLNFELTALYRSLVSGQRYRYVGRITLYVDCRLPQQQFRSTDRESITPL